MVDLLRPNKGGFLRPVPTTPFIVGFLKGEGPEGSRRIDPRVGAPMTDIHFEYKSALHRAYVRDVVEREEEKRIRKGLAAYSEAEYNERFGYYLGRIPYKQFKMRYPSFTRYFDHLVRLAWVRKTGRTERSAVQDKYPDAPPRVYYRITVRGRKASPAEMADPIQTLYHYSREQRSAKRRRYFKR